MPIEMDEWYSRFCALPTEWRRGSQPEQMLDLRNVFVDPLGPYGGLGECELQPSAGRPREGWDGRRTEWTH